MANSSWQKQEIVLETKSEPEIRLNKKRLYQAFDTVSFVILILATSATIIKESRGTDKNIVPS